ncbi:hypothetical protein BB560_002902 [Smittium megazygosporum]|uniref:Uncharacterized protein n=1 Tax=Smittium megazygosporum TaxID=133381 RepID=A0A2T9ZDG4_9FUNG|nr:hypothetical protein BB560_002902 [Smittium megazygosporum]
MRINCIAILDKDDSPIFIKAYGEDSDDELKYQSLVFTCIDLIEEKISQRSEKSMFLGLLQSIGALLIYGYVTNTNVKILLFIVNSSVKVNSKQVIEIFNKIHLEYINTVSNPFYEFLRENNNNCLDSSKSFLNLFNAED